MAKRDTILNALIDQLQAYGGQLLDGIDLAKYKDMSLEDL